MADEQFKAFVEAIEANEELQEKLQAAADVDAVVAIAKDAGFTISADDLKRLNAEVSEDDLDETLEQANGGSLSPTGFGMAILDPFDISSFTGRFMSLNVEHLALSAEKNAELSKADADLEKTASRLKRISKLPPEKRKKFFEWYQEELGKN